MPDKSDRIADDIAAIRETLAGIGLDDDSKGAAADAVRKAVAERSEHLDTIADAAKAVAQAVQQRKSLIAARDAATPSDEEIHTAQENVIAAAGTPDEQKAIDRLADLLDQKTQAQKDFESGESSAAKTLHDATRDLPDSTTPAGTDSGFNLLKPLLSMLGSQSGQHPPAMTAPPAAPAAAEPATATPESTDPAADLLNSLGSDDNPGAHSWGSSGEHGSELGSGEGQTHTAADEFGGAQTPTLSGVATAADVSGRSSTPFVATAPDQVGPGATGAAPMGGVPPMGGPMGGGQAGVAQGKGRGNASIMNRDPDLTGADIETDIATSGVVGRGEGRHS
ncbi:hypothetical protein B5P44_00240 [Mycobacterium sp. CBMA 213]|uniref:Uncharacterized protein n=1 Tax=Mycolicibacterium sp. CBMA 213 TaxID=1968788 RepID=A0A343VR26_9MYCO|nr:MULTISPECIES: hypothetical protein [unclassified Mycolicibacterium]AVN58350.1 hypothetical protein B5P44_p00055 [Mycolicibacterium sp. CBMA 213]MUL61014.1 hypothetical protein [Mycolicibacterium sp. CBMA 335]MUM03251.1 hypothetical protein [Mycolicibacterium sp. CBMA 213]